MYVPHVSNYKHTHNIRMELRKKLNKIYIVSVVACAEHFNSRPVASWGEGIVGEPPVFLYEIFGAELASSCKKSPSILT